MAAIATAPGHQERLRLVFATSDEAALTDIGVELAPAFFITLAPDSDALSLSLAEQAPEIVVLDLDTIVPEDQEVFAFVESVRVAAPTILLIVISRTPLRNARQRTKKAGGDEFLLAPVDFAELREYLVEAGEERRRVLESEQYRGEISQRSSFCGMIGASEAMQRVYEAVRRVAPSNSTVMLRGESGTGKELAARAIVSLSPRRDGPFIGVNCAALPENLMESELFGHEKGSFTGASDKHLGKFQEADGGTLFLDEIGELRLDMQVKLLRALQEGEVDPVGSKRPVKVDVRIISATNRDLGEMSEEGGFRKDLYYRLNVFPIMVPSLRARPADIAPLAKHFIARFAAEENKSVAGLTAEAAQMIERFSWPGNVRQLENTIFRAVVLCDTPVLGLSDFPQVAAAMGMEGKDAHVPAPHHAADMSAASPYALPLTDETGEIRKFDALESDIIRMAIGRYEGHMSEVARRLGIGRSTLYRKLKEFGLEGADADPDDIRDVG